MQTAYDGNCPILNIRNVWFLLIDWCFNLDDLERSMGELLRGDIIKLSGIMWNELQKLENEIEKIWNCYSCFNLNEEIKRWVIV